MRRADGTWETYVDHVLDLALDRMHAGEKIALVTLVLIDGASPRSPGDQMVVSETGQWVGYLSGGCIERAVVAEALVAIEQGENRRVRYGRGSKYLDIQLPCGSAIELVFDVNVSEAELEAAVYRLALRKPASLPVRDEGADEGVPASMSRKYVPRRRLIVAGIGPAAATLGQFGAQAGYEVVLHSPDHLTRRWAEAYGASTVAIRSIRDAVFFDADPWTAIVFMFHDHIWEQTLIPPALATSAFYIGAMGSRKTHKLRLENLRAVGVPETALRRIKGPCGLFAGAKSAHSIAISIMAEILQTEADAAGEGLEEGSLRSGPGSFTLAAGDSGRMMKHGGTPVARH